MKRTIVVHLLCALLALLFAGGSTPAQTVAYRKASLASNVPNAADNITPALIDPWGISFLMRQPFFLADNGSGSLTVQDVTGVNLAPFRLGVPNPAGPDHPTGIVADENSIFGGTSFVRPFLIVTEEGRIFAWGPDPRGDLPQEATILRDNANANAVYTAAAILDSRLHASTLAVANFHSGEIETFLPDLSPVALPGAFTDPTLPAGYAPFSIRVLGNQVFVSYALQDAMKHGPVPGAGNGIVSIFDVEGNFIRRFATGGVLNAPWAVAMAGANFGTFSNDILVSNLGDGTISAFNPATGDWLGTVNDGDGAPLVFDGLHDLVFRNDGLGDPNALFFTAGPNNGRDGLFGAITTGLVSVTTIAAPDAPTDSSVRMTTTVSAAPGNPGDPGGTVTFFDGARRLGTAALAAGAAELDAVLSGVGVHNLTAVYNGGATFLASTGRAQVQLTEQPTTVTLAAPADAAPGATILLTASVTSAGGIPTGQIIFRDGGTDLSTVVLDNAGAAALRINTLALGAHNLTAVYAGDGKFASGTSAAVAVSISNPDFSIQADSAAATVVAGQSAQFHVTVTPVAGFAGNVNFSCPTVTGITCAFSLPTVATGNGSATTTLTITTSANVPHFGLLPLSPIRPIRPIGSAFLIGVMGLLLFLMWRCGGSDQSRRSVLVGAAVLLVATCVGLATGCGGGYGNNNVPSNRGTANVVVTATSGAISHSTIIRVTVQ